MTGCLVLLCVSNREGVSSYEREKLRKIIKAGMGVKLKNPIEI